MSQLTKVLGVFLSVGAWLRSMVSIADITVNLHDHTLETLGAGEHAEHKYI